jgi:hypothetical protein
MFTLDQNEIDSLLKHSDPAVVAATKKLLKAEEDGEFVPKSRLSEMSKARKELETKIATFEAEQKKIAEDKARAAGELDKILEAEKKARVEAETKLAEETKMADQFRTFRKSAIESVKKQLGEKWVPEFETFSLESLSKLPGVTLPLLGVTTTAPTIPAGKYFTRAEIEALSPSEMKGDVLKKVNASLEHLSQP